MGTAIMLIIIGIILIVINFRAINKEKNSFNGILKDKEINMEEVQVEIGKLRNEFAETLLEIQTQIVELENKIAPEKVKVLDEYEYKDEDKEDKNKDKVKENDKEKDGENVVKEINNIKIREIEKFLEEGRTLEEIADILKIGKGEILLIKELYLK